MPPAPLSHVIICPFFSFLSVWVCISISVCVQLQASEYLCSWNGQRTVSGVCLPSRHQSLMAGNLSIRLDWLASESTGASLCLPSAGTSSMCYSVWYFSWVLRVEFSSSSLQGKCLPTELFSEPLLSELRKSHWSKYLKALFSVGHDGGVNEVHHKMIAIEHILWRKISLDMPQ